MKTLDLRRGRHSLSEALKLARGESLLIHSATGEDFLLEQAGDFDREAATLGGNEEFSSFLQKRASEAGAVPISKVSEKRTGWRKRRPRSRLRTG
jgi:hypothetical protein